MSWREAIVSKLKKISFGWEYGGYEDLLTYLAYSQSGENLKKGGI